MNPAHLSQGDDKENMRQAGERGRLATEFRNPACRLSNEQVREIHRRANRGESVKTLAEEFGIKPDYVKGIARKTERKAAFREVIP